IIVAAHLLNQYFTMHFRYFTYFCFFLKYPVHNRYLRSFPTRRSSDLEPKNLECPIGTPICELLDACGGVKKNTFKILMGGPMMRSEEHTSELQSRFDLVCRLLLEKKN